jgi:hypothetical protein
MMFIIKTRDGAKAIAMAPGYEVVAFQLESKTIVERITPTAASEEVHDWSVAVQPIGEPGKRSLLKKYDYDSKGEHPSPETAAKNAVREIASQLRYYMMPEAVQVNIGREKDDVGGV